MPLKEKIIVITGANDGIGEQIAKRFARDLPHLILASRDVKKTKDIKHTIGENTSALRLDVRKEEDVIRLAKKVGDRWGKVDILVNNAGVFYPGDIDELESEKAMDTFDVNLKGPYLMIKHFLPLLERSDSPLIINIGSRAGRRGCAGLAAYTASKYGLRGLGDSLKLEFREKNVRVTLLSPGAVDTKIHDNWEPIMPREHMLKTKEVADLAYFIASKPAHIHIPEVSIKPFLPE